MRFSFEFQAWKDNLPQAFYNYIQNRIVFIDGYMVSEPGMTFEYKYKSWSGKSVAGTVEGRLLRLNSYDPCSGIWRIPEDFKKGQILAPWTCYRKFPIVVWGEEIEFHPLPDTELSGGKPSFLLGLENRPIEEVTTSIGGIETTHKFKRYSNKIPLWIIEKFFYSIRWKEERIEEKEEEIPLFLSERGVVCVKIQKTWEEEYYTTTKGRFPFIWLKAKDLQEKWWELVGRDPKVERVFGPEGYGAYILPKKDTLELYILNFKTKEEECILIEGEGAIRLMRYPCLYQGIHSLVERKTLTPSKLLSGFLSLEPFGVDLPIIQGYLPEYNPDCIEEKYKQFWDWVGKERGEAIKKENFVKGGFRQALKKFRESEVRETKEVIDLLLARTY